MDAMKRDLEGLSCATSLQPPAPSPAYQLNGCPLCGDPITTAAKYCRVHARRMREEREEAKKRAAKARENRFCKWAWA